MQTYAQLLHEVKRVAAALRGLGLVQGDRITIYMPPTAMRAVTRTLRKWQRDSEPTRRGDEVSCGDLVGASTRGRSRRAAAHGESVLREEGS
jgi:acyl-CoA synthetase (AMP-forming)/AMP-acid ligase II